ncbi:lumenal Hsp70 protein, partial [Actinomortierella ambigua]
VENVMDDVDFKIKVTREDLERLSKDLITRVRGPLDTVLKEANMTPEQIQSIVLVGGGVRIPSVQASLAEVVGEDKLAKNVNGDEAAVMGAVFRGAGLSRQFKVKEVKLKDRSMYPIEVNYTGESKDGGATPGKPFVTPIYKEGSVLGTRKIVSFKRVTDFDFDLQYGEADPALAKDLASREIAHVSLAGLTAAVEKYKDVSLSTPKVKVTLELSDSGVLSVQEAVATIEMEDVKKPSLKDKVKSFFGGSESKEGEGAAKDEKEGEETQESGEASKEEKKQEQTEEEKKTEGDSKNSTADKDKDAGDKKADEATKKADAPAIKVEKITLQISSEFRGIAPLTASEKKESLTRIRKLDALDAAKRAREESRNNLESFLYRARELMERDEIIEVSTEEQRKVLSDKLSEVSEWFEDNEDADRKEHDAHLKTLRDLEQPMSRRAAEKVSRPAAFVTLESAVSMARTMGEVLLKGEESYHTPEEVQKLYDACDEVDKWIKEKREAQEKLALWEEPAVATRDIEYRGVPVEKELTKLMSKKKPKVTKKTKENATEKKAEEEKADDSTPAEEKKVEDEKTPEEQPPQQEQKEEPKKDRDETKHDEL